MLHQSNRSVGKEGCSFLLKPCRLSVFSKCFRYQADTNHIKGYGNLTPPDYEKCVADCNEAIKLDRTYTKALKRRATAFENLNRNEEAVRDFTAVTIIERFQDDQASAAVERCLKKLASSRAAEILSKREVNLPSPTFISAYLAAFRPHPKPALPESPSQGDQTLSLAFDALEAADYPHALTYAAESIEQGISSKKGQAEAYNLRGTFKFLMGNAEGARDDLQKSLDIDPGFVQSWVKIASVHMELGTSLTIFVLVLLIYFDIWFGRRPCDGLW